MLKIGNKTFSSRLLVGTGKYTDTKTAYQAIDESETEIVTVAIRRIKSTNKNYSQEASLLQTLDWKKLTLLPNTAGCQTAEEAIRVAFLGRELSYSLGQTDNNFIKLEVISDEKYLLPDPLGTVKAAQFLVREGFTVLPYINADPILAKHLEEIGCATVMPLASPIGSGQGIQNEASLRIIIENSNVPVIVDAGIGTASDACKAMELGASAVLLNTAIAKAKDPVKMAKSMCQAVSAGSSAYQAGRMEIKAKASASSPKIDLVSN